MSEEKKALKKSGSCEEMQEARILSGEELKQVVGGNPWSDARPQSSVHRYVAGSGCVFSRNCQAASKAECPYGSEYAENCSKFT